MVIVLIFVGLSLEFIVWLRRLPRHDDAVTQLLNTHTSGYNCLWTDCSRSYFTHCQTAVPRHGPLMLQAIQEQIWVVASKSSKRSTKGKFFNNAGQNY